MCKRMCKRMDMSKLSLENKKRLKGQGCTPERCMYWNTKTCLQCSKGVLWRELLKEAGHE